MVGFNDTWSYPEGHPVSEKRARELIAGDLGEAQREILRGCCAPFYWHRGPVEGRPHVLHSGTITFARVESGVIGITANHVFCGYEQDHDKAPVVLQVMNGPFSPKIISRSERLDLVTFEVSEDDLSKFGKQIVPFPMRPATEPQEGRGLMLAGFPAADRAVRGQYIEWGLFTALGVVRRVNEKQITWCVDHENHVPTLRLPKVERNKDMGGISGGPLLAMYETKDFGVAFFRLAGIIVEANSALENVAAVRTTFVQENGRIVGS